jgi:hypothetical protein
MIPKGPWDDEFREKYYSYPKVKENVARFTIMVKRPKSEEQKEKMRIANIEKHYQPHNNLGVQFVKKFLNKILILQMNNYGY